MQTIPWTAFLSLALILSCSKKTPPSFAVRPLEGSSIPAFASIGQGPSAVVDCLEEMDYLNDAPSAIGKAALPGTVNTSIQYLERAYARALFDDCETRRQALEESDGELRSSSEVQSILATSELRPPEDFTRFISWSGDFDAQENKGKLINYLLQNDNSRYKMRIDLNKRSGLKTIDSTFYFLTFDDIESWSRTYFREISRIEHYLAMRYHDNEDGIIVVVMGHLVQGEGSSSFMNKCTSSDPNAVCQLGTSPTELYLDGDGAVITETAADNAGLTTSANLNTLVDGVANLDRFYTGTVDEFFKPVFNP